MFGLNTKPKPTLSPATWEVTITPSAGSEMQFRSRLADHLRSTVERHLTAYPQACEIELNLPLFRVQARLRSGTWQPGVPMHFTFGPTTNRFTFAQKAESEAGLPVLSLPDTDMQTLDERLVGVEAIRDEILLRWTCQWDGRLDAWTDRNGGVVTSIVRSTLEQQTSLLLFCGDPGVGKSALAQAVADRYCRAQGISGRLFWLTTDVRGNGLVGDFGQRLRAAFETISRQPDDELQVLVIDEADAVAMRRSEVHAHQEDRAGTATLLQCLDSLAGRQRVAVILTTNLLATVDAAIQRRAVIYPFARPGREARQALLARWLPQWSDKDLSRAARQTHGMTPADIERALGQAYLAAVAQDSALTVRMVLSYLHTTQRTGRV